MDINRAEKAEFLGVNTIQMCFFKTEKYIKGYYKN